MNLPNVRYYDRPRRRAGHLNCSRCETKEPGPSGEDALRIVLGRVTYDPASSEEVREATESLASPPRAASGAEETPVSRDTARVGAGQAARVGRPVWEDASLLESFEDSTTGDIVIPADRN